MNLTYVPLLQIERDLHGIPRSRARFLQYLRTISVPDGSDIDLVPLLAMNPMGQDHVTAMLDDLLALDADSLGAKAAQEASEQLQDIPGDYRIGLVVADDLKGGGTNRYDYEFTFRFGPSGAHTQKKQRYWITALLWSSEAASARAVREAVLTAALRQGHFLRHEPPRTLRGRLAQEGAIMAMAGCTTPVLDADDLAYTREVITPLLDAEDMRTTVECLFGDAAARTLGFTPRGLSPWAGLALALHDARR